MNTIRHCRWVRALAGLLPACAAASGMQPSSSIVNIQEADGEASIVVQNTESYPVLLHADIQNLEEDPAQLVAVTPSITRVDPGVRQLVRFMLIDDAPLATERMKRVVFEGIPPKDASGASNVKMIVSQNLPVIIHPKAIEKNDHPWVGLEWRVEDGKLVVHNDTPYIVRLAQTIRLMPGKSGLTLPKTYILPGEALTAAAQVDGPLPAAQSVRLFPATVYGYSVDHFDAPLSSPASAVSPR